jgi:hypothetical protein
MTVRGFFSSHLKRVAYRRPKRIQRSSNDVDCFPRHHEGIVNDFLAGDNIPRRGDAVAVSW